MGTVLIPIQSNIFVQTLGVTSDGIAALHIRFIVFAKQLVEQLRVRPRPDDVAAPNDSSALVLTFRPLHK